MSRRACAWLEIFLMFTGERLPGNCRGVGLPKAVKLDGRNQEPSLRRIVGMCGKFRIEPKRADGRRILIASAVRYECLVRNVESKCSIDASFAHVE